MHRGRRRRDPRPTPQARPTPYYHCVCFAKYDTWVDYPAPKVLSSDCFRVPMCVMYSLLMFMFMCATLVYEAGRSTASQQGHLPCMQKSAGSAVVRGYMIYTIGRRKVLLSYKDFPLNDFQFVFWNKVFHDGQTKSCSRTRIFHLTISGSCFGIRNFNRKSKSLSGVSRIKKNNLILFPIPTFHLTIWIF